MSNLINQRVLYSDFKNASFKYSYKLASLIGGSPRNKVSTQFGHLKDNLIERMKSTIERKNKIIFSEDLKNSIFLVNNQPDDIKLLKDVISKYTSQATDIKFSTYQFGPVVMRLLYLFGDSDLAYEMLLDTKYAELFYQEQSYLIAIDLCLSKGKRINGEPNSEWPKDRRMKNSRRASDEFELYRDQNNQQQLRYRGYAHQHHRLYQNDYHFGSYNVLESTNKSSPIPGEEFLVTKSAHSNGLPYGNVQSKLIYSNGLTLKSSPLPLLSSTSSKSLVNQSDVLYFKDDAAEKRIIPDEDEDDKPIMFASKISSNIIRGPSYESNNNGVKTVNSVSLANENGKIGLNGNIIKKTTHRFKPTKVSLSFGVGESGSSTNNNNKGNNDGFGIGIGSITIGQSNVIKTPSQSSSSSFSSIGQSNEVKDNSFGGSSGSPAYEDYNIPSKLDKASIMSSALNVIGGNDDNTQLAHSILLVQRPKNRPKPISSSYYWEDSPVLNDRLTSSSTTSTTTPSSFWHSYPYSSPSSSDSYLASVFNNHRPIAGKPYKNRPSWYRPTSGTKKKKPIVQSLVTSSPDETPSSVRTTGIPFPFFDDDVPILMSNNHRKFPYSLGTRNKLTSEYANYWTTPSTTTFYSDISWFSSIRRKTSTTTTTTPSPQISISSAKPPLKVIHVASNKNKNPDDITSSIITVLDPQGGSAHLPHNTSVVHKNVLVPFKPGRPKPSPPSTTQYPIYPILAGITNWPIPNNSANNDMTVSWQWEEADSKLSGTTANPLSVEQQVTTSKSPLDFIDDISVSSSVNRPSIAIIGTRPSSNSFMSSHRPNHGSASSSSSSSSSSDYQAHQTTTQHIISVTPINLTSGHHHHHTHVIPPAVNTSAGHHTMFGEVVHASRPSSTSGSHQSESSASTSPSSQSFIVTTTTTTESSKPVGNGFVHAIYAPPMPSRPIQPLSVSSVTANPSTLLALFGVDSFSSLFTQLTVFRTLLFTALVILLPPLTLAAAIGSFAG